ncbi:MAG: FAD-dependent oxidoreductase, partial [Patescibacteria group bacterium]
MKKKNVIILGGGIAGLTTAWRLAELGVSVTVLERDKIVGGLSKTVEYKKFLFDYSAHRFNSDNPEVIRRFKQLVGKHCIYKKKITYIRHWGKYLTYPPKVWEVV